MSEKQHLATITILVKDRQSNAGAVQDMLTANGHLVMARMGVNVQPACVENCTGLITVTVKGGIKEIRALEKKIDKLYGIVAKACVMTE